MICMGPRAITSVGVREAKGDVKRGRGGVDVTPETGVMWPQAMESWPPAEAERDKGRVLLLSVYSEHSPNNTSMLNIRLPGL